MGTGYFSDGAVSVELGQHVFGTPSLGRLNMSLDLANLPAAVLDAGGGSLDLQFTGQRLRADLGDAERYVYELFLALARSAPGAVAFEDNLGHRAAFGDSVCVGASGQVQAFRFADMQFQFLSPEKSSEPAWGAAPATPAAYPGTTNAMDYAAGGAPIGTHPASLRIEMVRNYPLREVPRARGARSRGPESGAQIRFTVTGHAVVTAQNLAAYLEGLYRQIGPRPVDLTANGNTYSGVILEGIKATHTDGRHTEFEATFLQEIAPWGLTTTPAPYPTTTTAEPTTTTAAPTTTTVPPTTTTAGPTTTTTAGPTTTTVPPTTTTTVPPTTTTTVPPTTTTTAAPTTTTTAPGVPNLGAQDIGALESGGASANEGNLDAGGLQT